jgi:hypothetical protein
MMSDEASRRELSPLATVMRLAPSERALFIRHFVVKRAAIRILSLNCDDNDLNCKTAELVQRGKIMKRQRDEPRSEGNA